MAAQQTIQAEASLGARLNRVETLLICIGVAVLVAFWPSFKWLFQEWTSANSIFEHGFLLAATTGYLLLRSVRRMNAESVDPCWWSLPIVALFSFAWLLGELGSVIVVQTIVLPLILLASVCTVLGVAATRQLAFSILFIVFVLPVWELLQPFLQGLTIWVARFLIQLAGTPVVIEGDLVQLPSGVFRIASGCSGINFLVVGIALAALYGHIFYSSFRARCLLIAVATGVALVSNWLRVSIIIYIGDATNMQSGLVEDHRAFGWILFSLALIPLYLVAGQIGKHGFRDKDTGTNSRSPRLPGSTWVAAAAVWLAIAVGPVWAGIAERKYSPLHGAEISLPVMSSEWLGPTVAAARWQPEFIGITAEAIGRYDSELGPVWLYNNVYLSQSQGRELIFVHNKIGGAMRRHSSSVSTATLDGVDYFNVRDVRVTDGISLRRIWYWYEVDGSIEHNDMWAKLKQVFATLQGKPETGLVAVAALCDAGRDADCEAAASRMQSLLLALGEKARLNYGVIDGGLE